MTAPSKPVEPMTTTNEPGLVPDRPQPGQPATQPVPGQPAPTPAPATPPKQ